MGLYYGQILFWIIFDKYYKNNLNETSNDYYLIDELLNKWSKIKALFLIKKKIFIFWLEHYLFVFHL